MGEREKVVRILRKALAPAFKAVLGRGDGIVAVAGKTGYVWCRKLGRTELLITAYNRSSATVEGTIVLVRPRTLEGLSEYEIVDLYEIYEVTEIVNATQLQGRDISTDAPGAAEVLTWNATTSQWEPTVAGAPGAHALVGASHTAAGLTIGHVVRATGAAAFAWQQLQHTDLGAVGADQHHAEDHAARHEDGGADEVSVAALSGVLADKQDADKLQSRNVEAAAPGGGEVLTWNAGANEWQGQAAGAPGAHAASHQNGGADEVSVAALSGELADLQKVKDHTHQAAGGQGAVLANYTRHADDEAITGLWTFDDIITKGPLMDVRAWGAVGDGAANDTAAINNTIAAAKAAGGGTVFFPFKGGLNYKVVGPLSVIDDPLVNIYMEPGAKITYTGAGILWDIATGGNLGSYKFGVLYGAGSGIAIRVRKTNLAHIYTQQIDNFTTGILIDNSVDNLSILDNEFFIIQIANVTTGIHTKTGATAGVIQGNRVYFNFITTCKYGLYFESGGRVINLNEYHGIAIDVTVANGFPIFYKTGGTISSQLIRVTGFVGGAGSLTAVGGDHTHLADGEYASVNSQILELALQQREVKLVGLANEVRNLSQCQEGRSGAPVAMVAASNNEAGFNGGVALYSNRMVLSAAVPILGINGFATFYCYNWLATRYGAVKVTLDYDANYPYTVFAQDNSGTIKREILVRFRSPIATAAASPRIVVELY